ncbi:anthocyanidin 3-O-glucosyltransferase 2-like [Rhododendron vialii]|uniref:anthocyanidin 3-O-glucosyltransferase 2-like n=1 Tax=Rhododendron vialii TaxID=182163 RepID=UPI00265E76C6|nr:anthocyanidin 3-O-glucosyltransferase 2-like [Rhododendron vialii]
MKAAAELVFIPLPGIGHLVPTVEMAKQLVGRDHHLSITVLIMKIPLDKSKVSSSTQSLLLTAAEDRLKFVYLPQEEAAESEREEGGKITGKWKGQHFRPRVRDHVKKMMILTELTDSSRLAGFVVDMFCTPMMELASEFGLSSYAFVTSGCAFLGLMFHLETLNRDHNQDVTELKDSDAEWDVPVFVNPVPAKVLPSMVLPEEEGSTQNLEISKRLRETKGIMVNTFEKLESYAVKCLAEDDKVPPIYPVGPMLHLVKDENKEEEEEEMIQIMRWLDDQPLSSVVFLCFGSLGTFEGDQVREIAQALEQSGHRFLWSLRQPPPKGKFAIPGEYQDLSQVLPVGFLERTTEIGKVIGWAPQVAVLSHKSVGCFVSHCGWNSTLESLWCRVLMATWPIYAEQQMNAFQLMRESGLAVEIKLDYRKDVETAKVNLVTANEIENGIRKLMKNEDKSREGIKQKVKEMSEKSKTVVEEGGSSYNYIGYFIEVVMTNVHSP